MTAEELSLAATTAAEAHDAATAAADIARGLRVLAAQLDAGRAACNAIAAAGHGPGGRCHVWGCPACYALAGAEVAGLWTPEPDPGGTS
jgi:hypothetical protein